MSESAATPQPVIKDVQTLKANLKEQEKRARSENALEEVVPITDQQPPAPDAGEKRKRRKVSNPVGPTKDSGGPVLDGPLLQTRPTDQPTAPASTSSSSAVVNGAPATEENASKAVSTSPAESPAKASNPDARTASSVENSLAESDVFPPSSEVTKEHVASKDDAAHETSQEKTVHQAAHTEAAKEVPPEAKESAAETTTKPEEDDKVAAS